MTSPATGPPASERIQQAILERSSTDYVFHFWSAFGWTPLTFGTTSSAHQLDLAPAVAALRRAPSSEGLKSQAAEILRAARAQDTHAVTTAWPPGGRAFRSR